MRVATRTEMCCALAEASEQCNHTAPGGHFELVLASTSSKCPPGAV
jgi:hypothetical protein